MGKSVSLSLSAENLQLSHSDFLKIQDQSCII